MKDATHIHQLQFATWTPLILPRVFRLLQTESSPNASHVRTMVSRRPIIRDARKVIILIEKLSEYRENIFIFMYKLEHLETEKPVEHAQRTPLICSVIQMDIVSRKEKGINSTILVIYYGVGLTCSVVCINAYDY